MIPHHPLRLATRATTTPTSRSYLAMTRSLATLGIRREDPRRVWERRTPLTPEAVASLAEKASVEVESCSRRCFPDSAYAAVSVVVSCVMDASQAPTSVLSVLTPGRRQDRPQAV